MSSSTDLNIDSPPGFTLIEIVVAVAIFILLTVVAISALLSIIFNVFRANAVS